MSARLSNRGTNLTCSIDERVLIGNIHWCSLVEGTSPKHFDATPVHLPAGFFDLAYSIPNITAERDKGSMRSIQTTGKRCLLGYLGIFRGYGLHDTRVRASVTS